MRIMYVKSTVRTWSNKFKDLLFKSTNQFRISIIIELIPFSIRRLKKRVSEVFMFNLNKRILLWFLVVRVDKMLRIILKM